MSVKIRKYAIVSYKLFHVQMPDMEFDLRSFEIEGWPEGVDRLRPLWNSTEILIFDKNFSKFKFIPIPRVTFAKQQGFDVSDVDFDHDPSLTEKGVFEKLKQRYRLESRHTGADRIEWKQFGSAVKYQKIRQRSYWGKWWCFRNFTDVLRSSTISTSIRWATTKFSVNHSQEN